MPLLTEVVVGRSSSSSSHSGSSRITNYKTVTETLWALLANKCAFSPLLIYPIKRLGCCFIIAVLLQLKASVAESSFGFLELEDT